MSKSIFFDNLLTRLIDDSQDVVLLWQLGVLAVCALAAWGAMRLAKPYLEKAETQWSAGRAGIRRVGFPLLMLLALLLGRVITEIWLTKTHLLNLAVPLLLSLVGVVWQFPFLWEIALATLIGGLYWIFFRIPPGRA